MGESGAKLVVIDPATAAFTGVSHDAAEVRSFMSNLASKAAEHECGILLVAHSTKAARNNANSGTSMGAGAVAGSAAWFDSARSVLTLRSLVHGDRLLECEKANYGPTGWGAKLAPVGGEGTGEPFKGFELRESLDAAGVVQALHDEGNDRRPNRDKSSGSGGGKNSLRV